MGNPIRKIESPASTALQVIEAHRLFHLVTMIVHGKAMHCRSNCQRWSRGHKARGQGQGQGHKKNPRPRTAFPRTDTLEAKDRNARGQGPRTQPQVFSKKKKKKKGLQKSFSGNLQFKGVAKIFDWGGLNHKSRAMTSSKICLLTLNQDFAKGEGLN